jgi:multisubunit Na+/H+ antiporter MnhB subunit
MNDPDDERKREDVERRNMLVMIGAGVLVAIVGGWLMFTIHDYLAHERCLVEGHRYCDGPPIETTR